MRAAKRVVDRSTTDVPLATPARSENPTGHRRRGLSPGQLSLISSLTLGLILAILAWPLSSAALHVTSGLDPSWRATLAMTVHDQRSFGSQIAFSYGPLGFLVSPGLYYLLVARAAFLFSLVFSTGLFTVLIVALRRTISLPLAVLVAYVIGGLSRLSITALNVDVAVEDVLAVVMIICIALIGKDKGVRLSNDREAQLHPVIWVALGVMFSVFSLVKSSLCLAIGLSLLFTLLCLREQRLKRLFQLALGAIVAFGIGWFVTGNGFRNLVPFVKTTASLISGYAGAMEIEDPSRWYTYWLALFATALVLLVASAYVRQLPRRERTGVALITLATLWFLFKEGFVRHDYHDLVFFVAAPLLLAAFPVSGRLRAVQLMSMLALVVVAAYVSGPISNVVPNPIQGGRNFSAEVRTLLSSHRSAAVMAHSRRVMRREYRADGVTSDMVDRMQSHTADVSPWEQSLIWAYPGIRFDPLPVFQDYSAYTPTLDALNANYLASPTAPTYILHRTDEAIDGKDPYFEGPLTQLTIECRYRQVTASATWQLLARGQDRCGAPVAIKSVSTGLKHWVNVPVAPRGNTLVASFQINEGLWWEIKVNPLQAPRSVPYRQLSPGEGALRDGYRLGVPHSSGVLAPRLFVGLSPWRGRAPSFLGRRSWHDFSGGNGAFLPDTDETALSPVISPALGPPSRTRCR